MYLFKYNEISADTGLIQQQWGKSQLVLAYTSENLSYSCAVNFKKKLSVVVLICIMTSECITSYVFNHGKYMCL